MSAIPPNLVGPILQSPLAQGQISAARDNEEAQRVAGQRRQTGAITEADTTIETSDKDAQVFTDAEGSGSQGRAFSEADTDPAEAGPDRPGASGDEGHIDVEA